MEYKEYTDRLAPLLARYKNAAKNNCKLTAHARLRDMAKLYAEYRGVSYDEAHRLFSDSLQTNGFIPN